jgi:hypothetical protein
MISSDNMLSNMDWGVSESTIGIPADQPIFEGTTFQGLNIGQIEMWSQHPIVVCQYHLVL